MKIIPGVSSQVLATRIAAELGGEACLCEYKKFPDGELYTRVFDGLKDEEAIVVQSLMADTGLISLLQLIDAVEEAHKTTVVIPYLGYARQDKRFKPGEAISSRAIARGISFAGIVDKIYVVNVHNRAVLEYFDVETRPLDAAPLIGDYIAKRRIARPVIIGPDEGARELVKAVAAPHRFEYDVLEKKRISGDEVIIQPKELSVEAKNVVIVDDIISTGGTIAEAAAMIKAREANEIYVACIHGLFVQNATLRILNAGVKEIIATDTIESIFSTISVAKMIADELTR
ncbi:MAG: ribose-phosphate diphosphokinase [Methanophagales archaeon ANME-1-THS]|nr:MAG: ribose-phosphate diphosphokinase [Methanophagales archaeon ANME-1-THS]